MLAKSSISQVDVDFKDLEIKEDNNGAWVNGKTGYVYYNGELFTGVAVHWIGDFMTTRETFKDGLHDGDYTSYNYDTGKEEHFIEFSNGQRNGQEISWDEDGKVEIKNLWVKGRLVEQTSWDDDGNKRVVTYDENLEKYEKVYDNSGKLIREGKYSYDDE